MSEQRELEGVTALVTGATSGIGQAAAVQLGRRGAAVIVHGRDAARGAAVAGAITAAGGTARFAAADLNDPAQLDDLAGQAGSAGVLVNNAGFSWIGPTAELDTATFDRLYTANVRAPYFLVAALAPAMAARGSGSIINVGSQSGHIGMAGRRVQPGRRPGQHRRPRTCLHRHPARQRDRSRRRDHPDGARRAARGDRQRDRLSRLTPGQLHHRRRLRRRWRAHRHLITGKPPRMVNAPSAI
jgi:NAD(P)-dependent dehydrogenase (short-subunit alcohol dehydrogenase family)